MNMNCTDAHIVANNGKLSNLPLFHHSEVEHAGRDLSAHCATIRVDYANVAIHTTGEGASCAQPR
jgi:hypothetical protein